MTTKDQNPYTTSEDLTAAGALVTVVTYRNAVRDAAIDGWFWVSFDVLYAVPALAVLSGLLMAAAVALAVRPSRMWWLGWTLVVLGIAAGVGPGPRIRGVRPVWL